MLRKPEYNLYSETPKMVKEKAKGLVLFKLDLNRIPQAVHW